VTVRRGVVVTNQIGTVPAESTGNNYRLCSTRSGVTLSCNRMTVSALDRLVVPPISHSSPAHPVTNEGPLQCRNSKSVPRTLANTSMASSAGTPIRSMSSAAVGSPAVTEVCRGLPRGRNAGEHCGHATGRARRQMVLTEAPGWWVSASQCRRRLWHLRAAPAELLGLHLPDRESVWYAVSGAAVLVIQAEGPGELFVCLSLWLIILSTPDQSKGGL
jgi:hypothetical protein